MKQIVAQWDLNCDLIRWSNFYYAIKSNLIKKGKWRIKEKANLEKDTRSQAKWAQSWKKVFSFLPLGPSSCLCLLTEFHYHWFDFVKSNIALVPYVDLYISVFPRLFEWINTFIYLNYIIHPLDWWSDNKEEN